MEITDELTTLMGQQLSTNEEIHQYLENGKTVVRLYVKQHPYHDDTLDMAEVDFENSVIRFYEQHRMIFQEFIEKIFTSENDAERLEQLYQQIICQCDTFSTIGASVIKLMGAIKVPEVKVIDVKPEFLSLLEQLKYKYQPPKNKDAETITYLTDKLIKAVAGVYTESWIYSNRLQLSFECFTNYCNNYYKAFSKVFVKIRNHLSGFAYGRQIFEKAKVVINPKYLTEGSLEFKLNSGSTHSGNISLKNNPWRNGMIKGDMLFIQIKAEGKTQFVSFKDSLSRLFDKFGIQYSASKTDEENGIIKVDLDIVKTMLKQKNSSIQVIINAAFLGAISFIEFGCCSKYAECEKQGMCLHTDQLYATACQWQKHLKRSDRFDSPKEESTG